MSGGWTLLELGSSLREEKKKTSMRLEGKIFHLVNYGVGILSWEDGNCLSSANVRSSVVSKLM